MISDPIIVVTCDHCGIAEEFSVCPLAAGGWDDRFLAKQMAKRHWTMRGNLTFCAECSALDVMRADFGGVE